MHLFLIPILMPLFAFLYRCRGGFLGTGSADIARLLFWALPIGVWAIWQNPLLAPAVAVAAFLGLLIPHSWAQNDMQPIHLIGMSAIGMTRLALILAPLAYLHPLIMVCAPVGLLSGGAYYIGWKFLNGVDSGIGTSGFKLFGMQFAAGKFAVAGSEWGEVLTGAAFGLAFALAG